MLIAGKQFAVPVIAFWYGELEGGIGSNRYLLSDTKKGRLSVFVLQTLGSTCITQIEIAWKVALGLVLGPH